MTDAPTMSPTVIVTSLDSPSPRPPVRPGDGPFQAGQQVGPRYTIIRLLGTGGMGAVYQALDHELGVAVAIKVIRPAAQSDATAARDLELRFKRELVLARQVTHKYVVRIHDLGEIDGIKYLTMPFIEGETLAELLHREGRLPVARVIAIARQVALGLAAAHDKGVVHRDLKPENIMIEKGEGGDALIMDFGIARSVEHGSTQTAAGSVIGTLEYMAPEQAQGAKVDQRTDQYAFGLMVYDMLVGRQRLANRDNPMSELLGRLQQSPPAPRSIKAEIPEALDQLVTTCQQLSPDERYATTADLVKALDALTADGHLRADATTVVHEVVVPGRPKWQLALAALVLVAVAGMGGWLFSGRGAPPAATAAREPISVLIADFENKTGDAVFDGTIEQMLGLGVEGASFITVYPRTTAQRLAAELAPGSALDLERARLVATREGVRIVLAGSIDPDGAGYRITVRVIDAATGTDIAKEAAAAADKVKVMEAVGTLATAVRRDLGDADIDVDASRETFTAGSLEAAREYSLAQDLNSAGQYANAIGRYQKALEHDPNFGRAFSGWATAAFRLGRLEESDGLFKKAIALSERETEREKYRTLGAYYLGPGANDEQAIVSQRSFVERYPADAVGWNNLAVAYFNTLDFKRARENGQRAAAIFPKNTIYGTNLALYSMYASDFGAATTAARAVIAVAPRELAFVPIAVAAALGAKPEDARRAYDDMAKTGPRGAAIAGTGRADLALYEGRYDEAIALLGAGADADAKANQPAQQAQKLTALAEALLVTGKATQAAPLVKQALALSTSEEVAVPAGRVLVAIGQEGEARKLAQGLAQQVQKRRRAFGAVIEAEVSLKAGRHIEAIDALTAARSLADLWLVRFMLGRAYIEAGRFAEGLAEMEACQTRRGEGAAVFLNDVPTLRYLVPVSYWLARAQEGLGMKDSAAKNYAAFIEKQKGAGGDPLAADARKRIQ